MIVAVGLPSCVEHGYPSGPERNLSGTFRTSWESPCTDPAVAVPMAGTQEGRRPLIDERAAAPRRQPFSRVAKGNRAGRITYL